MMCVRFMFGVGIVLEIVTLIPPCVVLFITADESVVHIENKAD